MKYLLLLLLASPLSDTLLQVCQNTESVRTGQLHDFIQQVAERHAAYQAEVDSLTHDGWSQRYAELKQRLPEYNFQEVVAVAWTAESQHAAEMLLNAWRKSTPHWAIVNSPCVYYGYAMVQGQNGNWYACGIIAE